MNVTEDFAIVDTKNMFTARLSAHSSLMLCFDFFHLSPLKMMWQSIEQSLIAALVPDPVFNNKMPSPKEHRITKTLFKNQ